MKDMKEADQLLQDGEAKFNVDIYSWYRDSIGVLFYVYYGTTLLMCVICIKYRKLGRVFLYL